MEIKESINLTYYSAAKFEQLANQQRMQFNSPRAPVQQYIVNITFALELYLKCLIMIETNKKPEREHNLKKLFNYLSEDSLKAIQLDYKTQIRQSATLKSIRAEGVKVNANFWNVIEELQFSYNEWRYITIDGLPKKNLIGLGQLISSVKNRINELHQF